LVGVHLLGGNDRVMHRLVHQRLHRHGEAAEEEVVEGAVEAGIRRATSVGRRVRIAVRSAGFMGGTSYFASCWRSDISAARGSS
jgi:hypothetical protein